jgi:putative NADPH-quinone reductase
MKTARTLVIVTHPDIHNSIINKRWVQELQKHPEFVTVHQLHEHYPDLRIDVEAEQKLLLDHDNIILQFPFYWFSTPPLLKKWLDDVLLHGFAYGSKVSDRKLEGKKIGLAISAGIKEVDYAQRGRYHFTLEELVRPLSLTIEYISAEPLPLFAFYGAEEGRSSEDVDSSAVQYVQYIRQLAKMKPAASLIHRSLCPRSRQTEQ